MRYTKKNISILSTSIDNYNNVYILNKKKIFYEIPKKHARKHNLKNFKTYKEIKVLVHQPKKNWQQALNAMLENKKDSLSWRGNGIKWIIEEKSVQVKFFLVVVLNKKGMAHIHNIARGSMLCSVLLLYIIMHLKEEYVRSSTSISFSFWL